MKAVNVAEKTTIWTSGFIRLCLVNFLVYLSAYMLFPILAIVEADRMGMTVAQGGMLYVAFLVAMIVVGPFHAYLEDHYKRKRVYQYAVLCSLIAIAGYAFAKTFTHLFILAFIHGACFGLAVTAGITIAIDITRSSRRTSANLAYAICARLGMLIGVVLGVWLYFNKGFLYLTYFSIACGTLCVFLLARVHVPFRAPIGVNHCSMDRFFLSRGWLLAFNFMLFAFMSGLLLAFLSQGIELPLLSLASITILIVPFTQMLINLSQHCQRGTANNTVHLSFDVGILGGIATAQYLLFYTSEAQVYQLVTSLLILAVLFFVLVTYPYYKKKRIR